LIWGIPVTRVLFYGGCHFLLGVFVALAIYYLVLAFIRDKNYKRSIMVGLAGGIGGIFPDFDHILHLATQGIVPWTFLHGPSFVVSIAACVVFIIILAYRQSVWAWLTLSFALGLLSHCLEDIGPHWF
jgi:membrane-bound metal-dependent hydrolase YbcI (DUF457 family)